MEGVIVQGIGNIQDAIRRVHGDRSTIDKIWHRSVESPVPVWDPQGGGCGLILASLVWWVRCCNLLGIVPKNLLFSVSYRSEDLERGSISTSKSAI